MERLDARNHQFHDAVGLFLHHALHHHAAIAEHEHIDEEGEDKACRHGDFRARPRLVALCRALDGRYLKVLLDVVDDLLQSLNARGGEAVAPHLFVEHVGGVTEEVGWHFAPRIDAHLLGVFGKVARYGNHGLHFCRVGIVGGVVVVGNGEIMVRGIVLEERDILPGAVVDAHAFLLVAFNHGEPDWHEYKRRKDKRHEYGEQDKGLFAHARHKLALDDDIYFRHIFIDVWRG